MSVALHVQIQTRTGYARITLNQSKLLIAFYAHNLPVDYKIFTLGDVTAIYQEGWNLENLRKLITTWEPNKTNDNVKKRSFYHE